MIFDIAPDQAACITVLGSAPEQCFAASVLSVNGRRITVRCSEALSEDAAVKLSSGKYIILAEVVTSHRGDQTIILHVQHALRNDDVEQIRQRWT